MVVWYEVIKNLRDYIRNAKIAKIVEGGALNPEEYTLTAESGIGGAIFLIRDREIDDDFLRNPSGKISFFVENWVYTDATDPFLGYEILAKQEAAFRRLLKEWTFQGVPKSSALDILNVSIEETMGDADSRRPYLGSRTVVEVHWSER